jgi:flagellar hook protein FlgE
MSFGAFYAGLSGLQANSGKLGAIGNNLANVNTVGFKSSRVTFQDIFAQPGTGAGVNGAGNPMQVGLGSQIASIDQIFNQGSLQTTGLVTDVAIQGNGFFTLQDRAGGQAFSRAGSFTFDKDGNLVTPNGQFVQGYMQMDSNGNIVSSGSPENIQIQSGLTAPPNATSFISAAINLNSDAQVDDPLTALDESEEFPSSITVYDSLGARHNLTLNFRPVDTDADGFLDEWTYEVTVPGDEVTGGVAGTPFVIDSGTITFNGDGTLNTPSGNVTLNVPGWNNGAGAQAIDWRLFDSAGSGIITGYAANDSSTSTTNQDGYGVGQLRVLTVDQDGLISGVFTNGVTLQLARFALATFNNPNGLLKAGLNSYIETNSSGPATIGAANSGGRGITRANSLELSNVDITQEFTDLIISERGYQANSRIITTTDQVIQEALNLKR